MPRKLTRRTIKAILLILGLYLIASVAAGIFLAESSLHLPKRPVRGRAELAQVVVEQFHAQLEDVTVHASDGAKLTAWYAKPSTSNGDTVILLHGITDNRTGVAGYARMFLKHGYAVLLPDARAHGDSGGEIATYGVKEREDIASWTKWLDQSEGCVYVFGESMGAAIALQATAAIPTLCAVAVESPYSQFREIAYDRISRQTHTGSWFAKTITGPMLETSLLYTRVRYRVDLIEASPEDAMMKSDVPALLIHGTADKNIPIRHSYELMHTCGSHASLWVVQGADHGGAVGTAPEEFEQRVISWFQNHRGAKMGQKTHRAA